MHIDRGRYAHAGLAAFVATALLLSTGPIQGQQDDSHWVATWATALVGRPPVPEEQETSLPDRSSNLRDRTLRQVVRVSVGGSRVRVLLSNEFGTASLVVGDAHIGMRGREATFFPGTSYDLTFDGALGVTIPPGETRLSDPVDLEVFRLSDVSIDLYLPEGIVDDSPTTMHNLSLQSSYLSLRGNHAGSDTFPVTATTQSWFFLSRVEVETDAAVGAVVAFGDSITDGARSSLDENARWPNFLARRLAEHEAPMAVVNLGIGGNRVLSDSPRATAGVSALARFDRDVLAQLGATHVVVLEGINDIGVAGNDAEPRADDIIAGHQELIDRAHAAGLTIYGGTLLPFEGAGYYTEAGEAKRQAVNEWIRTSGAYDGVIDFDGIIRDPSNPLRMRPAYDSGDNLHPGDVGYQAMGEAVDLALFD